jgi:glycosyltransferase involved in cell wall biosynthesis
MSPRDLPALRALRGARWAAAHLRLLPLAVDPARFGSDDGIRARQQAALASRFPHADGPVVLCVAMMRQADKLDSYRLLAAALGRVSAPWRLAVVGDGPARDAVGAAFAGLPAGRVAWLGAVAPEALPPLYGGADLFAFPGLGEAFGLVYLEAAAAGLPVVACDGPGPRATVAPDGGLLTAPTPSAFAEGLAALLADPGRRGAMGAAARRFVLAERSTASFERRLREGLALLNLP